MSFSQNGAVMASDPARDIEVLLAPISEGAPAGVNLREDASPSSPYFQLKDARSTARAAERRGETEAGAPTVAPEWGTIDGLAADVLATKSKDLEIAAWYLESLARTDGFAGLKFGFALIRGLAERYWDTMFSLEDTSDMTTRLAPLSGLNGVESEGALLQPIRRILITGESSEAGPFSYYQYQQAQSLGAVTDEAARARREKRGDATLESFTNAVTAAGADFYIALLDDIAAAIAEFDAMTKALDERAGAESPPSSSIADLLKDVESTVKIVSKEMVDRRRAQLSAAGPAAPAGEAGPAPAGGGDGASGGGFLLGRDRTLHNREDALQLIMSVAEYFRATEPHSPISTTLEEAVRRARLPFAELLAELVPDQAAWRTAITIAGIKPPAPTAGS
jgi:type VI secretion system protein ImpA